jgi:hypothetical protein
MNFTKNCGAKTKQDHISEKNPDILLTQELLLFLMIKIR